MKEYFKIRFGRFRLLICTVGSFYQFSGIRGVVLWLDLGPLGLMYCCEFYDIRKSRFLLRILF